MRSRWTGVGPNPMAGVLVRTGDTGRRGQVRGGVTAMWRWRRGVRNDASTSQQLGGTGRMQGPALRPLDRGLPASRLCRSELPWSQLLPSLCEPVTPAEGHGHAPSQGGPGSPGSRPEKPPPGSVTSVSRQQERERADAALSLTRATVPLRLRPPCPKKSEQDAEPPACRTAGPGRLAPATPPVLWGSEPPGVREDGVVAGGSLRL